MVKEVEEEEEELIMCVFGSESLVNASLLIVNGLPAHLEEGGIFTKRPFGSLAALILPVGTLLLLLGASALPSGGGVPSIFRRRRIVGVKESAAWEAEAAAISGATVST